MQPVHSPKTYRAPPGGTRLSAMTAKACSARRKISTRCGSRNTRDAPDYAQASAAAAGEIFQLAIEKANSIDPKQVRDALAGLDATTFYGRIKFGATGQITSLDPPVFQIQGGKPVVIFPDYVKQGELKIGVK